jgi:hypothetical protein
MANPSNLYAEKIFSEHPLALWALDQTVDYISLFNLNYQDIQSFWTVSGATASLETSDVDAPFSTVKVNKLLGTVPAGATADIVCISPELVNFSDLNADLGTFCVGAHIYVDSVHINSISIGFEYTDTTTASVVQKLKTYENLTENSWVFVSQTSEIVSENTTLRVVIKITSQTGGATSSDYLYYINGVSVGQWSEEFNYQSLGVVPISMPAAIALTSDQVIPSPAYGVSGSNVLNNAYHIVSDNSLFAKNTSIPLVYGASNITTLRANPSGEPSLIVPGKGFLNKVGQYKDYTVEFWARINSDSPTSKKIFGPIASEDGLYADNGFLTLVIGKNFSSHFVGEWFRPMLIQIRLIRNAASLILNGEEVISLTIETDNLELPEERNESNKSQDWLGFYAYNDITPIDIDCVAIYSYQVPINVAKRRWVYGQGVISPEGINSSYGGTSAFIDYSFADYTANYSYPDFAQWQQGSFDNLTTTTKVLRTPEYELPEIFLSDKTLTELYEDNKSIQNSVSGPIDDETFITFRPNSSWNTKTCYLNFDNFNILNTKVDCFYGVFSNHNLNSNQTLFKIYNSLNNNYFSIEQDQNVITYNLYYNNINQVIYTSEVIESHQLFSAGINIELLIETFGGNVSTFFGSRNSLKVYIGGDGSLSKTFLGKMYSVGFATTKNTTLISDYFNSDGIAIFDDMSVSGITEEENAIALFNHLSSYTLLPMENYDSYFLDIGVSGSWQDYLPLSYFAQFVTNDVGNQFYDLDFLQFNVGVPSPTSLIENETVSAWTYADLYQNYFQPTQQTYYQFDNQLLTGWNNYEDANQNAVKTYKYDTTDSAVRCYLTFQYIEDGANLLDSDFTITQPVLRDSIIDVDEYENWETTKFEVVNNAIVYPSKTVDFNDLAIVYHLEFKVRGILNKPILLNRLQLASQAFNDNSFNPIGTRFGVDLFPYKRSGIYYDYKSKNPFTIYKGTTPYLYLTKDSGIQVRGDILSLEDRGISLPINQALSSDYLVSTVQLWLRYSEDEFPPVPTELFEIIYKEDTFKFYIVADSDTGSRARVFAKSLSTGQIVDDFQYYWNGLEVREPILTSKEWGVLGIFFSTALNFDEFLGAININGPVLFNNVAYYQANNLQQIQGTVTRPWLRVKTEDAINFTWSYWQTNKTWYETLVIGSSNLYGVSPGDIYQAYLGTNKIIFDDESGLSVDSDKMQIYQDVTWSTTVASAL